MALDLPSVPRLGVNIDHVATLRQLRGTPYPSLLEAARLCETAGAEQITVHLREDRRHIQDADVKLLRAELKIPLNLEMAATDAMTRFAVKIRPDWVCLVPEKRNEVTTEGGLALAKNQKRMADTTRKLKKAGMKVSLFVEPSVEAMKLSAEIGADAVELHTGKFCLATQGSFIALGRAPRAATRPDSRPARSAVAERERERILKAAVLGRKLGLHVHAGHGFDYENVRSLAFERDDAGALLI
jgi:pyridoxine 5-phosphate synthase